MKKPNPLLDKSYAFALRVVKACRELSMSEKEYVISRQLLKSGTSIGANSMEAQGGQSKKDFIAKIQIAYKEAKEAHYWLRTLRDTDLMEGGEAAALLRDCEELQRILVAILRSSKGA